MSGASEFSEIKGRTWNAQIDAKAYENGGEKYQAAILEQYKIYVEMADRISQRRGACNTFFLTLNTALATAATALWKDGMHPPPHLLELAAAVAIIQCVAWWCLVRSYRLLNGAKYKVIGVLEERLPASPYWRAEWTALGEGKDWKRYWPLSHVEQLAPLAFGAAYAVGFYLARPH